MLVLIFAFAFGVEQGKKSVVDKLVSIAVMNKDNKTEVSDTLNMSDFTQKQSIAVSSTLKPEKKVVEKAQKVQKSQPLKNTKPYTIQIIAYKKEKTAIKKAEALKKRGETSLILKSSNWFKVCVGSYANKDEARDDLKRLEKKYKGCFLRRK